MLSNSKLTQTQKDWLKESEHNEIQIVVIGKTTFAYKHYGHFVEFSTAICSNSEKKQRNKVGKYFALCRFYEGQTVTLKLEDFNLMLGTIADMQYI
jgi:hypothetical protein